VSVFDAAEGPCYSCLFPEPPAETACAEKGVLGVLPGVIGVLQATEAVKLLTGVGEPLVGRMLLYDALKMQFRTLRVKKQDGCAVCGRMVES
jgi:adenylyltransferase/sulfurtransferase